MRLSIAVAGLIVLSCGGGGGGSSAPTFNLMYEAPGGSGFAGGQVGNFGFVANVLQDFDLAPGLAVSGTVTDGAGAPLNNVEVSLRTSATSPEVGSATTDASGNYTITMPAGTWVAVLDSGSGTLGTMTVSSQAVTAPGPVTLDYQFPALVAVTGSLFEFGGPGIANAQVNFVGTQTGADVTVVADGVGFYSTSLVPDTYTVVVTPAGSSATTHLKERFPSILISAATSRNFSLQRGVQVSGIVQDNFGAPLLEATDVEVLLPAGSNFFAPTDVTANPATGAYSIGPVPLGSVTFELEAPGDSSFPAQQMALNIFGPTVQTSDLALARGFVLSGTIMQDDGVTAEGNVEVVPLPTNGSLPPDDDKTTNGSGFFEISLFAGTYSLQLTPDPTNMQVPQSQTLVVSGDTVLNVTLSLGATLTGTVSEPDGITPAGNVRVEIPGTAASAVTNGAGVYTFLAPVGTHTLDLTDEGGTLEDVTLAPVTGVAVATPGPVNRDITLSLAASGTTVVTGIVYEPDGVTPRLGVTITARHNTTGDIIGKATSDSAGAYTLVIQ